MKIIKILSLICFLTTGILAQTGATVFGTLYEQEVGGKAVSDADVKLVSTTNSDRWYATLTDGNGNYLFLDVPDGIYSIVYPNSIGKEERKVIVVKNGKIVSQEGQFLNRPSLLGEVSVIASGTAQVDGEISKTVNIIDAQQLRDRADFALPETLRTIPGLRVQQLGGFGRTASIKTRGLRNQDTALLLDGIRFRDAAAITGDASPFLSDITLTSAARIEVLRGSGSSLYGTNAIGGTIDFITPKPQSGLHGQIGGEFGNLGLRRFSGNLSDSMRNRKFGFNLGISRTVYTKGIDGEDDAHNTNFQPRIEFNPFPKTNISGRFFVSDAYVRLNSSPDTLGNLPASNAAVINAKQGVNFIFDQNDPDNFQKSKFFVGQLVLTQVFNDKLVFQGYYSAVKTSRKNDNGVLGVGFQSASTSVFDGTINTINGHFNWTPDRANQITAGYEFEQEKYGNNGLTPSGADNFFTRARQSSNTFYAQDLLKFFSSKLQFSGGVRAQFFNLKNPEFSLNNAPYANLTLDNPPTAYTFDGAASYFFKTGTKIRAHVGNGYRVPSLYERFGTFYNTFGTAAFVALGDPQLKPEKSIAYDAGIEQNLYKNRAKLSATYFYTNLFDTIGYGNNARIIPGTPRVFGGYLNTKGGIARGGEFSGQVKATTSTDVFASYTFTNSDQRRPQVAGNPNLSTLGIPPHQFTLVATQRFKRAWANLDVLATSNYLAPIFSNSSFTTYVYRFDGNRRADLTAGYNVPLSKENFNLRIYGTIVNLLNYDYYENGFRTYGRTGRIGLNFGF